MSNAPPADQQRILADVQRAMAAERWADAAALLGEISPLEGAVAFQMNVCRNFAAMQSHRPAVYRAIVGGRGAARYTIGTARTGHPTIVYQTDNGVGVSLSPGNDPVAGLSATFASIKQQYQAGDPMALLGIGDGYLIKSCALHPPQLTFGRQQAVYLFEPDPQAILACMTIHDYTGPDGPIEQERFHWFVGESYISAASDALIGDRFNPPPTFQVSQGPRSPEIGVELGKLLNDLYDRYRRDKAEVWRHYAGITRDDLLAAYHGRAGREPRAFLITTRNSSVLQYSTRDAAAGFEANGWETQIFIEPKPHQVVTGAKLMQLIAEFKPDLIFQIDHLRSEWKETYPPQLPFACWVQDHLPNLINREAGVAVTDRDYILLAMPAMYVERYGYPRRQCIDLSKLTRIPPRPPEREPEADDLVYVSSASELPADMLEQITTRFGFDAGLKKLIETAGHRMIAACEAGGAFSTIRSVSDLMAAIEDQTAIRLTNPDLRTEVVDALFDRLSNLLYRQQGLRWAKDIATRRGLTLAVYGPGWDKHPDFADVSRGRIAYGPELESLTRRAKINLVLEPFFCVSHQRLLDGLVAGGFFLLRAHPSNSLFQDLLNFLAWHPEARGETVDQVWQELSPDARGEFEELLANCRTLTGFGDLVNLVRGAQRSGLLLPREAALPALQDVSFASEADLEGLIVRHLADAARRREIAELQREDIEGRLSYSAGIKRVIDGIGNLIESEPHSAQAKAA